MTTLGSIINDWCDDIIFPGKIDLGDIIYYQSKYFNHIYHKASGIRIYNAILRPIIPLTQSLLIPIKIPNINQVEEYSLIKLHLNDKPIYEERLIRRISNPYMNNFAPYYSFDMKFVWFTAAGGSIANERNFLEGDFNIIK